MGWSPNLSFSLRDDQVSFGYLIIDKSAVETICQFLIMLKNGQQLNTDHWNNLHQTLVDRCYTNEEFEKIRVEFEQIKQDISDFKRATTSYGARWTASLDSLGSTVNYIAGSKTWIDKYIEYKQIAASLFNELKRHNYQFDLASLQTYEMRYRDVIQSSTQTELVSSYLEKQRREAMANGDPNANERFVQAMVETGCFTQEQAEQHRKMARLWDQASGNQVSKHIVKDVTPAPEAQPEETRQSPKNDFPMTQDNIHKLWDMINNIYDDPAAQDTCMDVLLEAMHTVYKEADIPTPVPLNPDVSSQAALWENAKALYAVLSMNHNKGLIDSAGVFMLYRDYKKIVDLSFQVPLSAGHIVDGYISTDANMVLAWYKAVSDSEQDLLICEFSDIVVDCLNQASIDVSDILRRMSYENNKRDRLSAIMATLGRNHETYDNQVPQVSYVKIDKLLRAAMGL